MNIDSVIKNLMVIVIILSCVAYSVFMLFSMQVLAYTSAVFGSLLNMTFSLMEILTPNKSDRLDEFSDQGIYVFTLVAGFIIFLIHMVFIFEHMVKTQG